MLLLLLLLLLLSIVATELVCVCPAGIVLDLPPRLPIDAMSADYRHIAPSGLIAFVMPVYIPWESSLESEQDEWSIDISKQLAASIKKEDGDVDVDSEGEDIVDNDDDNDDDNKEVQEQQRKVEMDNNKESGKLHDATSTRNHHNRKTTARAARADRVRSNKRNKAEQSARTKEKASSNKQLITTDKGAVSRVQEMKQGSKHDQQKTVMTKLAVPEDVAITVVHSQGKNKMHTHEDNKTVKNPEQKLSEIRKLSPHADGKVGGRGNSTRFAVLRGSKGISSEVNEVNNSQHLRKAVSESHQIIKIDKKKKQDLDSVETVQHHQQQQQQQQQQHRRLTISDISSNSNEQEMMLSQPESLYQLQEPTFSRPFVPIPYPRRNTTTMAANAEYCVEYGAEQSENLIVNFPSHYLAKSRVVAHMSRYRMQRKLNNTTMKLFSLFHFEDETHDNNEKVKFRAAVRKKYFQFNEKYLF